MRDCTLVSREKPTKLGKKLAKIRVHLELSQDGLVRAFWD